MHGRMLAQRYELSESMGDGPFAQLWKARARGAGTFSRAVAVRRLHDVYAARLDTLAASASRVAMLAHPALEPLLDVVREGSEAFWITEWIDGVSLATWSASHRARSMTTPWPLCVGIAIEILGALDALHVFKRTHEGVVPSAVRLDRHGRARLTRTGVVNGLCEAGIDRARLVAVGMAPALAPELAAGEPPSAGSDLFSAGWLLFEALAGAPPASGSPAEIRSAIEQGDVADLGSLRPDVPAAIVAIAERALRATARERFESAHAMARALAQVMRSTNEDTSARKIAKSVDEVAALTKPAQVGDDSASRPLGLPVEATMHVELSDLKRVGLAVQKTEMLDAEEVEQLRMRPGSGGPPPLDRNARASGVSARPPSAKPKGLAPQKTEFLDEEEVDRLSLPEMPKRKT